MPPLGKQIEQPDGYFLYIPLSRYILMSILTFGIYQVYWIYKNWEYLKNRDNLVIHPFWRGIFGIFFCHELFRMIHEDPVLNKIKNPQFNSSLLATGWVITVIIGYIFDRLTNYITSSNSDLFLIVIFCFVIIQLSFFIPVQQYINEVNEKMDPIPRYYPWSVGHFVLILLSITFFSIGLLGGLSSTTSGGTNSGYSSNIGTPATFQIHEISTITDTPLHPTSCSRYTYTPSGFLKYYDNERGFQIAYPENWEYEINSTTIEKVGPTNIIIFSPKQTNDANVIVFIIDLKNSIVSQEMREGIIQGYVEKKEEGKSRFVVTNPLESYYSNCQNWSKISYTYTTSANDNVRGELLLTDSKERLYIYQFESLSSNYNSNGLIFTKMQSTSIP